MVNGQWPMVNEEWGGMLSRTINEKGSVASGGTPFCFYYYLGNSTVGAIDYSRGCKPPDTNHTPPISPKGATETREAFCRPLGAIPSFRTLSGG